MRFFVKGAFAACFLFVLQGLSAPGPAEESLANVCQRLLEKPYDRSSMAEMSHYSVNPSADRQLRELAMSVYALAALANQDTNAFVRAKNRQALDFPEKRSQVRYDIRDCYSTCRDCYGQGYSDATVQCPSCGGTGRCTYKDCSGGRWVITAPGAGGPKRSVSSLPCPVCKGQSRCSRCNGVRTVRTACSVCAGTGILFKCPAGLADQYKALLRDMLARVKSEREFEASLQLARAETNGAARLELCRRLMLDFRGHPRIGEVADIKGAVEAELQRSSLQTVAARAATDENLAVLVRLAEANPHSAGETIQSFLAAHRAELTEAEQLKLKGLVDDCAVRVAKEQKRQKVLYVAGGLLVVLLALSCINLHFYRYTFLPAYASPGTAPRRAPSPPPTDPLRRQARESRVRTGAKATETAPQDE